MAADADDVRLNGFYGSGQDGAWRVTAHLSWRQRDGRITGGTVLLPGGRAQPSTFSSEKLIDEHARGWRLSEASSVLGNVVRPDAPVALVELSIPGEAPGSVLSCEADRADAVAACRHYSRSGAQAGDYTAALRLLPAAGALAVQVESLQPR